MKQGVVCCRENYLKRVGEAVRRERERQQLSLRQVAERCKVSHMTVKELEDGNNIMLGSAFEIAVALGLSPGVLFNPFNQFDAPIPSVTATA